ncbi:MAG: heme peroxidase family protein [Chloroflexi bacterium]|nr:heme peroxidase family protein [Chloroflexota bacterium]
MLNNLKGKSAWRRYGQWGGCLLLLATSLLANLPAYANPMGRPATPGAAPTPVNTRAKEADHPIFLPMIRQGAVASNTAQQRDCLAPEQTYGRMFASLPSATWNIDDLQLLALKSMAEEELDPTPEGEVDDEENTDIDAGYTYVGQFIDHDLTLDDRPNDLTTPIDPQTVKNFRTPQFDLDSVYGAGPTLSAQLYEADGMHLKLGAPLTGSSDSGAADLLRDNNGQAIIGDPRNDENRIVAQLHTVFIRFHNKIVDSVRQAKPQLSASQVFSEAQSLVLWHYQWAVLTDFLPTIVKPQIVQAIVRLNPTPNGPRWQTTLRYYNPCMNMPVEFSVAAYRFGHSMVRALYRLNSTLPNRLPVFSNTAETTLNLGGFSPAPSNFAIDWKFFFPMSAPRQVGIPQASYKIDGSLVYPLSLLPLPATGSGPANLAQRNLLRGMQLGLPTGQEVARAMGVRPLRDDQILVGKASGDAADTVAITTISPAFAGKTPLWSYIFAEATANAYKVQDGHTVGEQVAPFRLGAVGGQIVAETIVGLLKADPTSLFNNSFQPSPAFTSPGGKFGFKELIRAAIAD